MFKNLNCPSPISFTKIEKDKYIIEYIIIPEKYLGRIRAKTKISIDNLELEPNCVSEIYCFETFKQMEEFFENKV